MGSKEKRGKGEVALNRGKLIYSTMTWLLAKCLLVKESPNSRHFFAHDVEFRISYHLQFVSLNFLNALWYVYRGGINMSMSHGLRDTELNPADTGRRV